MYRIAFVITTIFTLLFLIVLVNDRGYFKVSETEVLKELSLVENAFSADEDEDDKFLIDRDDQDLWRDEDDFY